MVSPLSNDRPVAPVGQPGAPARSTAPVGDESFQAILERTQQAAAQMASLAEEGMRHLQASDEALDGMPERLQALTKRLQAMRAYGAPSGS